MRKYNKKIVIASSIGKGCDLSILDVYVIFYICNPIQDIFTHFSKWLLITIHDDIFHLLSSYCVMLSFAPSCHDGWKLAFYIIFKSESNQASLLFFYFYVERTKRSIFGPTDLPDSQIFSRRGVKAGGAAWQRLPVDITTGLPSVFEQKGQLGPSSHHVVCFCQIEKTGDRWGTGKRLPRQPFLNS